MPSTTPLILIPLALPLALLAALTTTLATSVLLFRGLVVNIQLGLALLAALVTTSQPAAPSPDAVLRANRPSAASTAAAQQAEKHVPLRKGLRHANTLPSHSHPSLSTLGTSSTTVPSSGSTSGSSSTLAVPRQSFGLDASKHNPAAAQPPRPRRSASAIHTSSLDPSAALLAPSAPARDFEGVGGWAPLDEEERGLFLLGANPSSASGKGRARRGHARSGSTQSAGAFTSSGFSLGGDRSAAVSPGETIGGGGGYFAQPFTGPLAVSPEESAIRSRMNARRLSVGSSGSSGTV